MSFQSDDLNLAKQFILSKVNVSSSGEHVSEENPELILKKKQIVDNLNLSAAQQYSKIGELLLTQEDNTEGSIIADALWKNSSVPNTYKDANAKLFSMIEQLLPTDYSPKLKNDAKTLFDILNINKEDISREQKKSKVYQLLNLTDALTVQTTVNEAVTSPSPSPSPDPAAHHDHRLDNSSSLIRGFREVTSVTTSGGHRTIGILSKLFDPFMRLYVKIRAADRLVTGEVLQSEASDPWSSEGQFLMKTASKMIESQCKFTQGAVSLRERPVAAGQTAALSFFNQSLSNTLLRLG